MALQCLLQYFTREGGGNGTTIRAGGGQNIELYTDPEVDTLTLKAGKEREREGGLAGDKDAVNLGCRINNYSVWMCKGPATPPDHYWCVNTVQQGYTAQND